MALGIQSAGAESRRPSDHCNATLEARRAHQPAGSVRILCRWPGTPDILGELGKARGGADTPLLIGFAAETGDPRPRARQKLAAKQVDLIVANDVSRDDAGFDTDTNAAVFISADGEIEQPLQLKTELASKILDRIEAMIATRASTTKSRSS